MVSMRESKTSTARQAVGMAPQVITTPIETQHRHMGIAGTEPNSKADLCNNSRLYQDRRHSHDKHMAMVNADSHTRDTSYRECALTGTSMPVKVLAEK